MISTFTTEEEFHAERQGMIGASDIPTLVGLNSQYGQTPYTLWLEKTGRAERSPMSEPARWGHLHEPLVIAECLRIFTGDTGLGDFFLAEYYSKRPVNIHSGGHSFQTKTTAISDEYPFAIAHADLWIPETKRIQEIKTSSFYASLRKQNADRGYSRDNNTSNGIPLSVYLQTQWQIMCYDAEDCGVSALIDTSHYQEYGPWKREDKVIGKLIELADKFYWNIKNDRPPMITTWEDYQHLFPNVKEEKVIYPLDHEIHGQGFTIRDVMNEYHRLNEQSKSVEKKLNDIKKAIGLLMGENKTLETPDGIILATMSPIKKETLKGIKEIEKQLPEIGKALRDAGLVSESNYKKLNLRELEE